MVIIKANLSLILTLLFVVGCAQSNCRRKKEVPEIPSIQMKSDSSTTVDGPVAHVQRVLIYKYDGSKQCGVKKGQSLAEMEKDLQGIKIFSREKRPDGLMHIQVCGADTGMANVYEISAGDLAKAEAKNFKLWKF